MSPTDMIRAHLEENGPSTAVQLRKALGLRSQTIRNCISGLSRKKGGIRKVGEVKQRIGGPLALWGLPDDPDRLDAADLVRGALQRCSALELAWRHVVSAQAEMVAA